MKYSPSCLPGHAFLDPEKQTDEGQEQPKAEIVPDCPICGQAHEVLELSGFYLPPIFPDYCKGQAVFEVYSDGDGGGKRRHHNHSFFVMKRGANTDEVFAKRQQARIDRINQCNANGEPLRVEYVGPCTDGGYRVSYEAGPLNTTDLNVLSPSMVMARIAELNAKIKRANAERARLLNEKNSPLKKKTETDFLQIKLGLDGLQVEIAAAEEELEGIRGKSATIPKEREQAQADPSKVICL